MRAILATFALAAAIRLGEALVDEAMERRAAARERHSRCPLCHGTGERPHGMSIEIETEPEE